MPYNFTCEHCGAQFSRVNKPTPIRRYRFCSLACKGAGLKLPMADRFWPKVSVGREDECWPWLGARDEHGYGVFNVEGKVIRTHRVAFFLEHGRWPEPRGLHKCDNPPCSNPAHIFEGTMADNTADMIAKGRAARPRAKLTDGQVRELRERVSQGEKQCDLARHFALTTGTVANIVNRKSYRHLD